MTKYQQKFSDALKKALPAYDHSVSDETGTLHHQISGQVSGVTFRVSPMGLIWTTSVGHIGPLVEILASAAAVEKGLSHE